jgi:Tol biopolymer transport system component
VADQDTDGVFELYAVVVDKTSGDTAVKISGTNAISSLLQQPSGEYVFGWAPNSSRVAYIANQNPAGAFELFTATPDGIANDQVSGALVVGGDVNFFQWEPDSTLIAYAADQDTNDVIELYVSAADSNTDNVRVSGVMAGSGLKELLPVPSGRYAFDWAPDSSRIAYIADQDTAGEFELYTSTSDGTGNPTISKLPASNDRDVATFAWAPSSLKIAYTANQAFITVIDLFTAAPDGSGLPLQISNGLLAGQQVTTFKWAPDSSWVTFISDKGLGNTGFFRLFTTSPNNNNNIFISGSIAGTYDVIAFEWAPSAVYIAYTVEVPGSIFQLFTTFPDNATSTQISDDLFDGDEEDFEWSPDSSRIAYIADQDTASVFELFASVPDGSVSDTVSGTPVIEGDVLEFKWSTDSSALGYLADQDINGILELFASLPNGNENTKLSGTLVNGGGVFSFDWVP